MNNGMLNDEVVSTFGVRYSIGLLFYNSTFLCSIFDFEPTPKSLFWQ